MPNELSGRLRSQTAFCLPALVVAIQMPNGTRPARRGSERAAGGHKGLCASASGLHHLHLPSCGCTGPVHVLLTLQCWR